MTRFQAKSPNGEAVQELEVLVRTALFKSGNEVVGNLLQWAADRADAQYQPKPGEERKGRQELTLQCLFGSFSIQRDYYYHPGKKQGHYPADAALGLEGSYTPALARLICLEGADCSNFRQAQLHLAETGGIPVSSRQIQRVVQRVGPEAQGWQEREIQPAECARCEAPVFYVSADGTGAPMRKKEVEGRAGKRSEKAKTRQVYLGCVFTQHDIDEQGRPIRDEDSTTYVSAMKTIQEFGPTLRREALRRGLGTATKTVLLIDGAEGLEHMGRDCFKEAVQIVDFYHAREHASAVLVALLGSKEHPDFKKQEERWTSDLLRDQLKKRIARTRKEAAASGKSQAVEKELGYFLNNLQRMQYGSFRQQGYFIGSGVVEAGCKTIIGSRCKQSGMFWSVKGAENILAFRCIHTSHRLESFWKYRLNTHAARNDTLALAA